MVATRRLYLLRHAKAVPAAPGTRDYDRMLDVRGESDARALGALLHRRGAEISQVITSGAARTRGTWTCLAGSGLAASVAVEESLYNGDEAAYAKVAEACAGNVLIIGHNPSISAFARSLSARGDPAAVEAIRHRYPTATLAVFRLDNAAGLEGAFLEDVLMPPYPTD